VDISPLRRVNQARRHAARVAALLARTAEKLLRVFMPQVALLWGKTAC